MYLMCNLLCVCSDEFVAQFKFTAMITPTQTLRLTSHPQPLVRSEFAVTDPELKSLLASGTKRNPPKKSKKKGKKKTTAAKKVHKKTNIYCVVLYVCNNVNALICCVLGGGLLSRKSNPPPPLLMPLRPRPVPAVKRTEKKNKNNI